MKSSLKIAEEMLSALAKGGFVASWILSEIIEKVQDDAFLEGSKCKSCKEPMNICRQCCDNG